MAVSEESLTRPDVTGAANADAALDAIVAFLSEVGLSVEHGATPDDAFLPGVILRDGGIVYTPEKLFTPGDLLHEAGHLAVVPAAHRHRIGADADAAIAAILGEADAAGGRTPVLDGLDGLGAELQAIAWSYAACVRLGLPLEIVFVPGAYGTDPNAGVHPMTIAQQIALGFFPGVHRLVQAGMAGPAQGPLNPDAPPGGFPTMTRWLQA
jgi:hypothetical protein